MSVLGSAIVSGFSLVLLWLLGSGQCGPALSPYFSFGLCHDAELASRISTDFHEPFKLCKARLRRSELDLGGQVPVPLMVLRRFARPRSSRPCHLLSAYSRIRKYKENLKGHESIERPTAMGMCHHSQEKRH